MDAYPSQFVSIIEDEIIPALEAIENYDPTPDTPYDFFHRLIPSYPFNSIQCLIYKSLTTLQILGL